MIPIHESSLLNLISFFKKKIDEHILYVKSELENFKAKPTYVVNRKRKKLTLSSEQLDYLDLMINDLASIVKANTITISHYKNRFDGIIKPSDIKKSINIRFRNELSKILGYETLRSVFYPSFYEKLGIKACVYCNSQLTVTVNSLGGLKTAKFQVDHFLPKSEYPCFSISFFNLYPVCASCNHKKASDPIPFNLYANNYKDIKESDYSFSINKRSLVKYRVNGDETKLKVEFKDRNNSLLNSIFNIEGIYNTQKDLAAEIITKSLIYNDSYKLMLKSSFDKLYGTDPIKFKRFIVGNYTEENEIHKRPLAKFTQDIAKDLRLIV